MGLTWNQKIAAGVDYIISGCRENKELHFDCSECCFKTCCHILTYRCADKRAGSLIRDIVYGEDYIGRTQD